MTSAEAADSPDDVPAFVPCRARTFAKSVRRLRDMAASSSACRHSRTSAPRRGAVLEDCAVRHLDLERGWVTFFEKGEKIIDKPIPHAFLEIVHAAIAVGVFPDEPDEYVVPMLRKQTREGERDDRVIWRIIKDVGIRAGLPAERVFPHALRHAFSVRFLEQRRGDRSPAARVGTLEDRDDADGTGGRWSTAAQGAGSRDVTWDSSAGPTAKRRRADSNRCTRLCRPLPNHSATSPGGAS